MSNVDNWDPELQRLAAEYSPGLVITSFAVREHIATEGYRGIKFMEGAETKMKRQTMNVKNKVEKEMNDSMRKHGKS